MKSPFQTIIVFVFIGVFVIAIAVFSGIFSSGAPSSTKPEGRVLVWGIFPQDMMTRYINGFNAQDLGYTLDYEEHPPEVFSNDLIVALANGTPPDVVLFNSEIFSAFRDKLFVTPYAAYSERVFRDTTIDGGNVFLDNEGIIAFPLLVDPLVVYYNKDLLAAASFVVPPRTWTDLTRSVPLFTKRDARNNISQTAIALGEGANINHSRDILSALFLQTGTAIVEYDRSRGIYSAALNSQAAEDALSFFVNFSNPTSSTYSWNRALPTSLDMFVAGRSAFYIGRASELFAIQAQNPNLNFDVTELFQSESATRPITFGSFVAVAMLKNSLNPAAAAAAMGSIVSDESVDNLSKRFSLPPVRKSLLQVEQTNPYVSVFFRAALSAFSWPDPDAPKTEVLFQGMIQNVTSGRTDVDTAINEANRDLQFNIR